MVLMLVVGWVEMVDVEVVGSGWVAVVVEVL